MSNNPLGQGLPEWLIKTATCVERATVNKLRYMANHYSDWYSSTLSVLAHSFWQCFHSTVLHTHTHKHAYTHTHTYIYMHACTHTHMQTFTHMIHTCTHTHTHEHTSDTCMHTHTYKYAYIHTYSHICIHTNTCIYTLKNTHRHRHACTHKYATVCTQMDTYWTHKLEIEGKVLHGEMTKEINSTEKT